MNNENDNINLDEIRKLANIIDASATLLQTSLKNLLDAKEAGCLWYWFPRREKVRDDISFLRCKLMELSKMLDE